MNLKSRIEAVEKHFSTDDADTEAVIIFTGDCRLDAAPPEPVTMFTVSGEEIHLADGETYQDFEARAVREAFENLPAKVPGQPSPVPVLIANGSMVSDND